MPRFDEFSWLSAGYLARRLCDRDQGSGEFLEFFAATLFGPIRMWQRQKKKRLFQITFFFSMYIIWTLFIKDTIKRGWRCTLTNVAKTTGQPSHCCLILNRSRELYRRNTDDWWGRLYNWLQSTDLNANCFPPIKEFPFKTTLKKAQRVIKHDKWLKYIVNIILKLSL